MSEQAAAPRPDVNDMYAVHGVFRDTLGAAPTLVGGIAPGDAERVALIANYYENILSFLEAHHDGEEKLVFPLLRERCAGQDALIDHMDEQHQEALALLEEAKALAGGLAGRRRRGAEGGAGRLDALRTPSGRAPRRGGDEGAAPGGRATSPWRSGGPAGTRHGQLPRRQDLADPRPHPRAHDRRAAGGDAGAHAAARASRCGPGSASRRSRTTRRWSWWRSSTTPEGFWVGSVAVGRSGRGGFGGCGRCGSGANRTGPEPGTPRLWRHLR